MAVKDRLEVLNDIDSCSLQGGSGAPCGVFVQKHSTLVFGCKWGTQWHLHLSIDATWSGVSCSLVGQPLNFWVNEGLIDLNGSWSC